MINTGGRSGQWSTDGDPRLRREASEEARGRGDEVVAVIPARYGSSRLPGKPLLDLGGIPLIVRVMQCAAAARGIDRVVVATDDERIAEVVRTAGGEAMMTSPRLLSNAKLRFVKT